MLAHYISVCFLMSFHFMLESGDDILRYLLVLELKERYDGYTIKDENTRCISVTVIPTRDGVQVCCCVNKFDRGTEK